jgi:8-oxo-dGTP pyrophosphatase MutT (NUDIX family)
MKKISAAILITRDGNVVLQRRTKDDLTKPGMLALFGGHMEEEETPDQAIEREISEETSLKKLVFEKLAEQHWYVARIDEADFNVYEGAGAEVFTLESALARTDLSYSTRYALERLKYENRL